MIPRNSRHVTSFAPISQLKNIVSLFPSTVLYVVSCVMSPNVQLEEMSVDIKNIVLREATQNRTRQQMKCLKLRCKFILDPGIRREQNKQQTQCSRGPKAFAAFTFV